MAKTWAEFDQAIAGIVTRFFRQQGRAAPAQEDVAAFSGALREVIEECGLPRPLPIGERGAPGGLPDDAIARRVARLVRGNDDPVWHDLAKQLVKTCFYPEFADCRDSFRERAKDGACRRQEIARVRARVSGTHCVDCPYWVTHAPAAHGEMLADAWVAGRAAFAAHRELFLPEDFRRLRLWLHAAAREGMAAE